MSSEQDNDGASTAATIGKAAIFALGTVAAISIGFALLKPLIVAGLVAGAGYMGYRVMNGKSKALTDGKKKALGSNSDFDSKWAELEAAERKLDREIGRKS